MVLQHPQLLWAQVFVAKQADTLPIRTVLLNLTKYAEGRLLVVHSAGRNSVNVWHLVGLRAASVPHHAWVCPRVCLRGSCCWVMQCMHMRVPKGAPEGDVAHACIACAYI